MKPEALVFDLDGTLWDAIDICVEAWNEVLEASHYAHPDAQVQVQRVARADFLKSMGKTHEQILELYFTALPLSDREILVNKCYEAEIPKIYAAQPRLYDNVKERLQKLKKNYRLALVSNCQRPYLQAFLSVHNLKDLFEATLCFGDTGRVKGANLRDLIGGMSVVKSAAYIGDTMGDQEAAMQAGVPFYFAAYGFGQVETSVRNFSSFQALSDYFESLTLK